MRKIIIIFIFFVLLFSNSLMVFAAFTEGVNADYYPDFISWEEEQAAADKFNIELASESFVLLKNENRALPLTPDETNISLFGTGSYYWSSPGIRSVRPASVYDSLSSVNLSVNPTIARFYQMNWTNLEEPSLDNLEEMTYSYDMYDDAAVITIWRSVPEWNEVSLYETPGHTDLLDHTYSLTDNEKSVINGLTTKFDKVIVLISSGNPMELGWLEDHDGVDAILWIGYTGLNGRMAVGPMLVGETNPSGKTADIYPAKFSQDPTWANFKGNIQDQLIEVDGVLYTNYIGPGDPANVLAPAEISGLSNSSAEYLTYSRVTDISGNTVTVDGPNDSARYFTSLDYEEGIYVGYRWYETAAQEGFFSADSHGFTNAERLASLDEADPKYITPDLYYNRLDGVIYPFGYGLSYTTFDVDIQNVVHDGSLFLNGDTLNTAYNQEITLNISITNTGNFAGKKIVEIYYTAPYITGEIEKASINLINFAKSDYLYPGESQVIPVTIRIQDMASFDDVDANADGHQGYELDPGTYTLSVRDNSHDTLDSIDAVIAGDIVHYDIDADTGASIELRFTPETGDTTWDGSRSDLTYYNTRRTAFISPNSQMTYLTRADFDGTMPKAPTPADLAWSDEALMILLSQIYYSSFNDLPTDPWYIDESEFNEGGLYEDWTQVSEDDVSERVNGLVPIQLYDMSGVPLDDPQWIEFMNQLTWDEIRTLVSNGQYHTEAIDTIGKPRTNEVENFNAIGHGTFWVSQVNIASTWNIDLAYRHGRYLGNEAMLQEINGLYGPNLNIHRSPASNLNYSTYSQDGILAGLIGQNVVKGATDKGIVVYIEDALMDAQNTNHYTVTTFISEQALREMYLKPFEMAIKNGNANALMSSSNKIGIVSSQSNYNLHVGLLRDEFGFDAFSITSYYSWSTTPSATGDMCARVFQLPLGHYTDTFGRHIEGEWDDVNQNVIVTFNGNVTSGTRYISDTSEGIQSTTITSYNPVLINFVNNNDYVLTGGNVERDYEYTTTPGPSAAFSDATNMLDGTTLYEEGDNLASYTQWVAVRNLAQSILYEYANSTSMENGIDFSDLVPRELTAIQYSRIYNNQISIALPNLDNAVYTLASINSTLPEGLSLSTDGQITGTTSTVGTFSFVVTVIVDDYITRNIRHTLTITPAFSFVNMNDLEENVALTDGSIISHAFIIGSSIITGDIGDPYLGPFLISTTLQSIEYSVFEGSLPNGLTLDTSGNITGTPTTSGSYNVTVLAHMSGYSTSWSTSIFQDILIPTTFEVAAGIPLPTYDVTFAGNFTGASDEVVAVVQDTPIAALAAPYRPGAIFLGWFTDAAATTAVDFSANVAADVTYYAGWVDVVGLVEDLAALDSALDADVATINAAIDAVDAAITALQTTLEAAIAAGDDAVAADIATDIAALQASLDSLNSSLDDETGRIDDIETQLAETGCGSEITLSSTIVFATMLLLTVAFAFVITRNKKQLN